jgi:hypothetical protein
MLDEDAANKSLSAVAAINNRSPFGHFCGAERRGCPSSGSERGDPSVVGKQETENLGR